MFGTRDVRRTLGVLMLVGVLLATALSAKEPDAAGIDAVNDQMRNPVGQCVGFSRSCASDDKKGRADRAMRPHAVFHSAALRRIKVLQICRSGCQHESPRAESVIPC